MPRSRPYLLVDLEGGLTLFNVWKNLSERIKPTIRDKISCLKHRELGSFPSRFVWRLPQILPSMLIWPSTSVFSHHLSELPQPIMAHNATLKI